MEEPLEHLLLASQADSDADLALLPAKVWSSASPHVSPGQSTLRRLRMPSRGREGRRAETPGRMDPRALPVVIG